MKRWLCVADNEHLDAATVAAAVDDAAAEEAEFTTAGLFERAICRVS